MAEYIEFFNAFSAFGTMLFTAALMVLTGVLCYETKKTRLLSDRIYRESLEPNFIIYTHVDEVENRERVVLENASNNPAYNVSLNFNPDITLDVYKEPTPERHNSTLSGLGFPTSAGYPVFPPNYKTGRTVTFRSNGGDFNPNTPKIRDVIVEISYELQDGSARKKTVKLDSSLTEYDYWGTRNSMAAICDEIKKSSDKITSAITNGPN